MALEQIFEVGSQLRGGSSRVSYDWNTANRRIRAIQVNGNVNIDLTVVVESRPDTASPWVEQARGFFSRTVQGVRELNINNLGWLLVDWDDGTFQWLDLENPDLQRVVLIGGVPA